MCVIDEHQLAGGDIQYRAPNSRSRLLSTCVLLPKRILQYPVNTILEENKRLFEGLIASPVIDSTSIWNAVFV